MIWPSDQEVERAALHGLPAEVLVLLGDQHDDRDAASPSAAGAGRS
ncbi:MAG: hypothetical protein MZW92_15955 [Comamonadaceae bacterium]|nr:hypothetical protein [Comamonadaceae bacterium]